MTATQVSRRRRFLNAIRRIDGRGTVEFALVMPAFALLLFGLLDLGRLVYVNNAMSEGAREGARWGSVMNRARTSDSRATIQAQTVSVMTGVPAPVVTVTCQHDSETTSTCKSMDTLVVQVDSTVTMVTPLIAQIVGPLNLSVTSSVAVNQ
jgi:Flp pilus assembly protein TadG